MPWAVADVYHRIWNSFRGGTNSILTIALQSQTSRHLQYNVHLYMTVVVNFICIFSNFPTLLLQWWRLVLHYVKVCSSLRLILAHYSFHQLEILHVWLSLPISSSWNHRRSLTSTKQLVAVTRIKFMHEILIRVKFSFEILNLKIRIEVSKIYNDNCK